MSHSWAVLHPQAKFCLLLQCGFDCSFQTKMNQAQCNYVSKSRYESSANNILTVTFWLNRDDKLKDAKLKDALG